ncbi:MAG: hypothetical protein ACFBSC_17620 [Microcoleaceae cyanobacterium]
MPLSKLDEITKNLEKDVHLVRIKKVMFCACSGRWENNADKLAHLSMRELVQELYLKTQTLDRLYQLLDYILSKLNKKSDYSLVVNIIISQLSKLYFDTNPTLDSGLVRATNSQTTSEQAAEKLVENPTDPLDQELFDVRFNMMQHGNPLRVKLLLFSSLEHEFNDSEQDWSQLRSLSLDNLVRQIFYAFPNLTSLRSHLQKLAEYLDNPEENLQAATVLLDAIQPLYDRRVQTASGLATGHHQFSPQIDQLATNLTFADLGDATAHALESSVDATISPIDLSESQTVHIITNADYEASPGASDANEAQTAIDPLLAGQPSNHQQPATPTDPEEETTNSSDLAVSELQEQYSQPLFQTLNPEQRVRKTVDCGTQIATRSIEVLFNQLDVILETDCLREQVEEQRSQLKAKALRQFLQSLKHNIAELEDVLSTGDSSADSPQDSDASSQDASSQDASSQTVKPSSDDLVSSAQRQKRLLALAKQGNAKAIAQLLNQSLKPRGIKALAQIQGQCLRIVLESPQVPAQDLTAAFVHKKLMFLDLPSIHRTQIYGRKTGNSTAAWQQEFTT